MVDCATGHQQRRDYGTDQFQGRARLKQQLEAEAREKGVRPSDIVRQALEEHMRPRTERPNCRDLAERLGLIGSAKGLPRDLSTNPSKWKDSGVVERRVLIDTGPIVAILSDDDEHHDRCTEALTALSPPLSDLLAGHHGSRLASTWAARRPRKMFDGFQGGLFALLPLNADDLPAVAAVMKRYESAGLQLADAAIAHLAEREGIRTVFTTDCRGVHT